MPKLASVRVKAILISSQFIFNSFGDVYCRHFIDINSERFASTVLERLSSRWQQSFTLRRLRRAIGDVNSCWICIKGEERKFASWWQRNFFCGSLWWQILLRPELIYDLTMLLPWAIKTEANEKSLSADVNLLTNERRWTIEIGSIKLKSIEMLRSLDKFYCQLKALGSCEHFRCFYDESWQSSVLNDNDKKFAFVNNRRNFHHVFENLFQLLLNATRNSKRHVNGLAEISLEIEIYGAAAWVIIDSASSLKAVWFVRSWINHFDRRAVSSANSISVSISNLTPTRRRRLWTLNQSWESISMTSNFPTFPFPCFYSDVLGKLKIYLELQSRIANVRAKAQIASRHAIRHWLLALGATSNENVLDSVLWKFIGQFSLNSSLVMKQTCTPTCCSTAASNGEKRPHNDNSPAAVWCNSSTNSQAIISSDDVDDVFVVSFSAGAFPIRNYPPNPLNGWCERNVMQTRFNRNFWFAISTVNNILCSSAHHRQGRIRRNSTLLHKPATSYFASPFSCQA